MSEQIFNGTETGDVNFTSRRRLAAALNNANLGPKFTEVREQVATLMLNRLATISKRMQLNAEPPDPNSPEYKKNQIKSTLNMIGPAAAGAALEYTLKKLNNSSKLTTNQREQFRGKGYIECAKLLLNDGGFVGDGLESFNNVLRQFLLPRYAYLDFDTVVDPRHRVDLECGYPKYITPIMYRYMYDRDDMAAMVNDLYPNETHANEPCIYDEEDEKATSPFEDDLQILIDERNLLQTIYRMDKLSGIGHYGALLIGIDDGKELDQPVAGIDEWGKPTDRDLYGKLIPGLPPSRQLLFMRPFDEYLSFVQQYETNINSPRYGQPVMYNLVFLDMTIDAAGASIGTRLNRRVHWTRVVHCMPNERQSSLVFAIPRMQRVFNRLLDLRKIKGADAEGMWNAGFPGLVFEANPEFVADDPDFDIEEFKKDAREFSETLQRSITLKGIKAYMLSPNLIDPDPHVRVHIQAIAMAMGAPIRMLLGVEEARVSGSQEEILWNKRLGRHIRMNTVPYLYRPVIDRLIAMRLIRGPKPQKNSRPGYFVCWPDLDKPTDEDKANLSLKWTQAMAQYVASGMIHLIDPMDYLTVVLGLRPVDAIRIMDKINLSMLTKVDPSQPAPSARPGAGGVSKGDKEGTTGERQGKVDTADKQIQGGES